MHDMNKMKKERQKPNHEGNNISHSQKWQELELRIWKVVSGALHGIKVKKIGEDTPEHPPTEVTALLFDKLARPHGPTFEAGHDLGEEAEEVGIISFVRVGDPLVANGI